jgi:hypothetical protein
MLAPEKGRIDQCVSVHGECRILPNLTEGNEREAQLAIELRNDLPPAGDPSPSDLRSLRLTAGLLRLANHRFMTGSQLLLGRIKLWVYRSLSRFNASWLPMLGQCTEAASAFPT